MNKKKYGIAFFVVGVLVLVGAGCSNHSIIQTTGSGESTQPETQTVTTEECARLFAFAPKIDLRYNDLATSHLWTLKYYDRMAALEKKTTSHKMSFRLLAKQNLLSRDLAMR